MNTKVMWSKREDDILKKAISDFPGNRKNAYEAASHLLNRTAKACELHWYQIARVSKPITIIGSKKELIPNRKNITIACQSYTKRKTKKSFWKYVLDYFN